MAYKADVYRIMIGTPSDINEEIEIIKERIYEWNNIHSYMQSIVLLPMHWANDTYPNIGDHPQKIINKQVTDKSDMLICVFGTRLGSPTSEFESGTLEEINEHLSKGKPVMIYFKNTIENLDSVDVEQFQKVRKFKTKIKTGALYRDYSFVAEFKDILYADLQKAVNDYFLVEIHNRTQNPLIKEEIEEIPKSNLLEYDIDRLIKWTGADNPTFYSAFNTGGSVFFGLGAKNQYEVKAGKEMAEWKEFFDKLIKLGFVEKEYKTDGNPTYELKKAAYDFVYSLNPKGRE